MQKEVELIFANGKWHIHDNSGKCYGAFTEKKHALEAAIHSPNNLRLKH